MKTYYTIKERKLIPCEQGPGAIVVYANPDAAEKQQLAETLQLDAHALESALDADEIPRIEFSSEQLFIVWKRPRNFTFTGQLSFGVASVGIVLRQDQLVFIADDELSNFQGRLYQGVASLKDVALRFMLETVHHYLGHLKAIKQLSADIQAKLSASMENRYLLQMFNLGESLIYYLDAIEGNGTVLTRLRAMAEKSQFSAEEIGKLDDIAIDNMQCSKQAQIYSSVLSGLMDARGNIINNNMNVLLKNLTLINVVFLPLNLIAGIGGMSEYSMMTRGLDWRFAYLLFMAGIVVLGWVTWIVLVRRISAAQSTSQRRNS